MWDDPALDVAPFTPFPSTFQVRRTQDDSSYEWAPMEVLLFPYDIIRQNVNQLRNTGSTFMTYLDISHSQVDITSWLANQEDSFYDCVRIRLVLLPYSIRPTFCCDVFPSNRSWLRHAHFSYLVRETMHQSEQCKFNTHISSISLALRRVDQIRSF